MKRAIIPSFKGIAEDRYGGSAGEFAQSKHFDVLSNPKRLTPIRGMSADTASTGIGNIIVASDGLMYGVGLNAGINSKLWVRSGYGGSDGWRAISVTNQTSGGTFYDFLVDWPDSGAARTILWSGTNILNVSVKDAYGSVSVNSTALPFTTIGQGVVHPKNRYVYFTYKTASTHYLAFIAPNATDFAGLSATAWALPFLYRSYCVSHYRNYIAVPLTDISGGAGGQNGSEVQLWTHDTTLTQPDEVIPWGSGRLLVLNNLGGALVGVSHEGVAVGVQSQDSESIVIRAWDGGTEPTIIKTITARHLAATNHPSVTLNYRVNFVYNNRLYFSINVDPNDAKQTARYGLWSVGRNTVTGEWSVVQEQVATNANTETGVIAAAMSADFVSMAHTAEGTLTFTTNGNTGSTVFAATSSYESLVNPGMDEADKPLKKKLMNVRVRCLPLPTGAQIVLKYRVDSDGDDADWITAYTYTTTDGVGFNAPNAVGTAFTDGYNYEFQLLSTGQATPIAPILYDYEVTEK
jgi:hypothetical protein